MGGALPRRSSVWEVQIGNGRLFNTATAVVVGGTIVRGEGGVPQTFVGVLTVSVLSNGMVLMGVPPALRSTSGPMIIGAVCPSIARRGRQMSAKAAFR